MPHASPSTHASRSPARGLTLALALALMGAAACRAKEPPQGPLDADGARARASAIEARLAKDPKDIGAHRDLGSLQWMYLQESKEARRHFEVAAAAGDLVAHASLMVMANARLDHPGIRRHGQAILSAVAKGEKTALTLALAEVAARFIDQDYGGEAGGEDEFITFFDALDRRALPAAVTQPLLSRRAAIARIREQDYQPWYDAEGCVRAWQVGALAGTLAEFELRHHQGGPLTVDAEAVLTPLACVVRVWNPTPRAGARRMQTTLAVPGSSIHLELSAQQPFRAYLDGQLIHRSDRDDRWPARTVDKVVAVEPGPHRLEIHVALPRDKAWVLVRATDERGAAIPSAAAPKPVQAPFTGKARAVTSIFGDTVPKPLDPQIYRPWSRFFAAADALADGDSDRAEIWARSLAAAAPTFPEGQAMVAVFEAEDPTRDKTASAAREQQALAKAIALEPGLLGARIRLFELGLGRGEVAEVLEAIGALPPKTLDNVEGQLLRFRAYLARGSEAPAEAALERALEIEPRSCEALRYQRQLAQQRGEVEREDAIIARADHCPGQLTVRAGLAERRGRLGEARALLEKALARTPDDTDVLQALTTAAVADGDLAAVAKIQQELLRLNPYSARARVTLADLAAQAGASAEARADVEAAIDHIPASSGLHEIGREIGIADDLETLRIDGLAVAREYLAARGSFNYEGVGEVLVLDRSAARIYGDGSVRQIVHTIAEVRTKEAIDRYGEIVPPEGAKVLTLHTIKPDGQVIEPESIAGKDGLSLRGLAIGDLVEYELVDDAPPNGFLPGYVDLSTFRFQSFDVPFHVSELVVMHPTAMPIQIESRAGAPTAKVTTRGDLTVRHFRVERSPRRGVEVSVRSLLDEVPSVRVYTPLDLEAWLGSLSLRIYKAQRANPELRRLAHRLTRGKKDDRARLVALWSWVVEKIDDAGDISAPATLTLSARRGNRTMLLRALLREVGVRSELWVARDRFTTTLIPGGHPLPETYEAPILMVWLGDRPQPIPVLTNSKVLPIGYIPTNIAGAPALRLQLADGEPAPGAVTMPAVAAHLRDARRYDLDVSVGADGEGTIKGTITLSGMEAAYWREGLRNLDRDRLQEAFERAELGILIPGAAIDLDSLDIDHEKALQEPLILRFAGTIHGVGVVQGGDRVIRSALVPMNLGLGFTSLATRTTGMLIPYAPVQEAVVTIRWEGAAVRALPKAQKIRSPFGSYVRAIDGKVGDHQVIVRTRSTLLPGIVEPEDYDELAEMTRSIRAAEEEVVRVR